MSRQHSKNAKRLARKLAAQKGIAYRDALNEIKAGAPATIEDLPAADVTCVTVISWGETEQFTVAELMNSERAGREWSWITLAEIVEHGFGVDTGEEEWTGAPAEIARQMHTYWAAHPEMQGTVYGDAIYFAVPPLIPEPAPGGAEDQIISMQRNELPDGQVVHFAVVPAHKGTPKTIAVDFASKKIEDIEPDPVAHGPHRTAEGIELASGHLIENPEIDGLIRIRDLDGDTVDVLRPEDDGWAEYAEQFGVSKADFEGTGRTSRAMPTGEQVVEPNPGTLTFEWVELGEGTQGDYDPSDPDDVELLRLDAWIDAPDGMTDEDELHLYEDQSASYCTQVPVSVLPGDRQKLIEMIADKVVVMLTSGRSLDKATQEMSWAHPTWLTDDVS